MSVGGGAKPPGASRLPQVGCSPSWLGGAPSASHKCWGGVHKGMSSIVTSSKTKTSPLGMRRHTTTVRQSCGEQFPETRVLPSLCASRWTFFWSFPGPISGCLPTPTLSLAWPSLGESHLPPPTSCSPPSQLEPPSLARRSKALFLGARPVCLGGPRKGGAEPRASAHGPPGPGRVGGGRRAAGAGGEELRLAAPLPRRV